MEENDEGTTWSMSSNGGISRSSHDDGICFRSKIKFFELLIGIMICRSFGVKYSVIKSKYFILMI